MTKEEFKKQIRELSLLKGEAGKNFVHETNKKQKKYYGLCLLGYSQNIINLWTQAKNNGRYTSEKANFHIALEIEYKKLNFELLNNL